MEEIEDEARREQVTGKGRGRQSDGELGGKKRMGGEEGEEEEEEETREKNQQQHKRRVRHSERQTNVSGFHQRCTADDWTRTNGAEHRRPRLMVLTSTSARTDRCERRGMSDGAPRGRGRAR